MMGNAQGATMIAAAQSSLEGTVWRYQESKTEFTTIKFTSGRGGYFLFNRYERKFIFTYTYDDGVGVLIRDKQEFRSSKDADRLANAQFLIERDTLVYDGREFVRMRGLENNASFEPPTTVKRTAAVATDGGTAKPAVANQEDAHYNGTHNSGVRPARYEYAEGDKAATAAATDTQQAAAGQERQPSCWGVGTDVSGFEDRNVVGSMPKAVYDGRDQGKNVVRIWVDRDGKVVRAEVNQTGTTLTSNYFASKAQLVASRLQLEPKPKAARLETGFLTVVFSKQ